MGKKPHKSFPEESEKNKIRAQSQKIKQLEKEINRLKSELATLNKAFRKSADYMADESGPISVEQLIKDANEHKPLIETKKTVASAAEEREQVRQKWAAWAKERAKAQEEE